MQRERQFGGDRRVTPDTHNSTMLRFLDKSKTFLTVIFDQNKPMRDLSDGIVNQ